jgi:hypothetical protein
VRKRESLLKSIYERRKGEGWLFLWGKSCSLSRRSLMSYPKKNNKNINRASKNKILATAHASFGNPFAFKTANFVPKEARANWLQTTPPLSRRAKGGSVSDSTLSSYGGDPCPFRPQTGLSPTGPRLAHNKVPAQSSMDFLTDLCRRRRPFFPLIAQGGKGK